MRLIARPGHPDFLDLPWAQPLAKWRSERLVELVRGISRHVVRFVEYEGRIYALKELPERYARREYGLLRRLGAEGMPVVDVVGVATDRTSPQPPAEPLGRVDLSLPTGARAEPVRPEAGTASGALEDAILITRHLDYSLPYRALFSGRGIPDLQNALLDALVGLLVRIHLAGFFWGDCSLSNTLFRRDAGGLSAYLVDAETGELHPTLSEGQRKHDVAVARENVAGELLDVQAEVPETDVDAFAVADEVEERYERLWDELTSEEVIQPDERHRIEERLRRLNELGFDVEEIELETADGGYRLRLDPHVVEPGHHRRRLLMLTGLNAQENQARRMLNDLARFRAELEEVEGRPLPESVAAYRWRADVFEPAVAAVPAELWTKLPAAEVFHQILEHRWFLAQELGRDITLDEAIRTYLEDVLRHAPDERTLLGPAISDERLGEADAL